MFLKTELDEEIMFDKIQKEMLINMSHLWNFIHTYTCNCISFKMQHAIKGGESRWGQI